MSETIEIATSRGELLKALLVNDEVTHKQLVDGDVTTVSMSFIDEKKEIPETLKHDPTIRSRLNKIDGITIERD